MQLLKDEVIVRQQHANECGYSVRRTAIRKIPVLGYNCACGVADVATELDCMTKDLKKES